MGDNREGGISKDMITVEVKCEEWLSNEQLLNQSHIFQTLQMFLFIMGTYTSQKLLVWSSSVLLKLSQQLPLSG